MESGRSRTLSTRAVLATFLGLAIKKDLIAFNLLSFPATEKKAVSTGPGQTVVTPISLCFSSSLKEREKE